MRDIPHDIMQAAYQIVSGTKFRGTNRDIAVLTVAQGIQSERDRVAAHVNAARLALVATGDGSASLVHSAASAILSDLERAILAGETP